LDTDAYNDLQFPFHSL